MNGPAGHNAPVNAMESNNPPVTDAERAVIAGLAQVLIPAGGSGPSADEVDAAGKHLNKILETRPDLELSFLRIVRAAEGVQPAIFWQDLESSSPEEFQLATYVIVGAYFLSDRAREWLGFDRLGGEFQTPTPEDDARLDELLAPVRARAATYRPSNWRRGTGTPNSPEQESK